MSRDLDVSGTARFGGNVTTGGRFSASGGGFFGGGGSFDGDVQARGNVTINRNLDVTGAGNFLGRLNVAGVFNAVRGNFSGDVVIQGSLAVTGTKSSTAQLSDGRTVALYAVESPENWFEDFGSAQLHDGVAEVEIEAAFRETINTAVAYHVFLTPNGDCRGLYVAKKTPTGFEVRELAGGTSNAAFDYRVVARRRAFENLRLKEVQVSPSA